jgi:hypothetical protein
MMRDTKSPGGGSHYAWQQANPLLSLRGAIATPGPSPRACAAILFILLLRIASSLPLLAMTVGAMTVGAMTAGVMTMGLMLVCHRYNENCWSQAARRRPDQWVRYYPLARVTADGSMLASRPMALAVWSEAAWSRPCRASVTAERINSTIALYSGPVIAAPLRP